MTLGVARKAKEFLLPGFRFINGGHGQRHHAFVHVGNPAHPRQLALVQLRLERHGLLPLRRLRIAHAPPVRIAVVRAEAATRFRRDGIPMRREPAGAVMLTHALVDEREGVDQPLDRRAERAAKFIEGKTNCLLNPDAFWYPGRQWIPEEFPQLASNGDGLESSCTVARQRCATISSDVGVIGGIAYPEGRLPFGPTCASALTCYEHACSNIPSCHAVDGRRQQWQHPCQRGVHFGWFLLRISPDNRVKGRDLAVLCEQSDGGRVLP